MQLNNLLSIIEEICKEKNISQKAVKEAIEHALAAAYKKDFGKKNQNIKVEFDLISGKIKVFDIKTVVEDLVEESEKEEEDTQDSVVKEEDEEKKKKFNPKKEIFLSEAKKINKKIKIGDEIKTELQPPDEFGRMAAQSAKQVIMQKIREEERKNLYEEFKKKEGAVMTGLVQRRERENVLIDLERLTAILPYQEQIKNEKYQPGTYLKVYLLSVNQTAKRLEVIVSRSHPKIMEELFKMEIPEIANGIIEIKAIAREAGMRSKIAVLSKQKEIDPVGACIGQRGVRIQTIIAGLGGEKIDIIEYSEDPLKFISNALAPAKISSIQAKDEKEKIASVKAKDNQIPLAIGKDGQNVRLAAKLTGWHLEIEKEEEKKEEGK